jgi:6-pyruvoyltetrahydropterin/6-carboxytetrahydropterin synthase
MSVTCTRRLEWDSMHRLPGHEGHCRCFHGHRYVAEITCIADQLDVCGRIVDFGVIKERVGAWIDQAWDHTAILMHGDDDPAIPLIAASNERMGKPVYWLDGPPSAENIVQELARISSDLLEGTGVQVDHIRLWETPNCSVAWQRGS